MSNLKTISSLLIVAPLVAACATSEEELARKAEMNFAKEQCIATGEQTACNIWNAYSQEQLLEQQEQIARNARIASVEAQRQSNCRNFNLCY